MNGLRGEMMGEIKALTSSVKEAETKRSADVDRLTSALKDVPKASDIRKTIITTTASAIGIFLAIAGLLLTVFDVGASVAGSFGDDVVDIKHQQQVEEQRYNAIADALKDLRKESPDGRQSGTTVRQPVEGNVVGNGA